ncbi:hypothetical protein EXN66_Car003688 [Channa argus]|uniref:Uncharacterized protein n=1 Tax=Channa argus TaxID=215402 RepID=A0A6G1PDB3_CHAAH|nr:hypothetical protein EXN66_Car003688 [Channa argus]
MSFSETLWIIYTGITEPKYTTYGMGERERTGEISDRHYVPHSLHHHHSLIQAGTERG